MNIPILDPDCTPADIVEAMQLAGACIVRELLPQDSLTEVNAGLKPWISRSEPAADDFSGRSTQRTGALVARCPQCRPLVTHPLILAAANSFLAPHCERCQRHLTQTIHIMPGQTAQVLHRDRLARGGYLPKSIEPLFLSCPPHIARNLEPESTGLLTAAGKRSEP